METETVAPIFTNSVKIRERMSGQIDLYYFPPSPPCRAVMLVANAVGVTLNKKMVNITKGEQMLPEYIKLNPEHTIPTFDDGGFILWEGKAILKYLVDAYGKDETLAPKEAKAAALINQRLYFDSGTLYPRLMDYFKPIMFANKKPDQEKAEKFEEALTWLNLYLENQVWAAGQYMTIADFSLVVTISTAEAIQFDIAKYPNIWNWYQRCQKAMANYGYQEVNQTGADMIAGGFKKKLEENN